MTARRYFCAAHGYVKPDDRLMPTCPKCGGGVSPVNGTPDSS